MIHVDHTIGHEFYAHVRAEQLNEGASTKDEVRVVTPAMVICNHDPHPIRVAELWVGAP